MEARVHRCAVGAVALAAIFLGACRDPGASDRRLAHQLLLREREALERQLSDAGATRTPDVRVAIPASLIRDLVSTDLPFEATVDRFRVVVREADVDFRGALARVDLGGAVRWADREGVEVELALVGALEVLDVDPSSGSLEARVDILGVRTRDVRVGGLSPPAERLLDALARRPVEELQALVREIEIPVQLLRTVELPAVEEDEVSIGSARVPLSVGVVDVRVGDDLLVVELDVEIPNAEGSAVGTPPDGSAGGEGGPAGDSAVGPGGALR